MVNVYGARLKSVLNNEKRTKKRPCDNKALFRPGAAGLFQLESTRSAYFDW
jgi:hypothetical protein